MYFHPCNIQTECSYTYTLLYKQCVNEHSSSTLSIVCKCTFRPVLLEKQVNIHTFLYYINGVLIYIYPGTIKTVYKYFIPVLTNSVLI